MSGKSRQKTRKQKTAAARRDTGPGHAPRQALRLPGLRTVYQAVLDSSTELTAAADALDAELWLGATLGTLRAAAPTGEAFQTAMLDLIDQARRDGRPDCLVLLRTMAAVGPQGLTEPAARAAEQLMQRAIHTADDADELPRWIDLLGETSVEDCYLWTDAFTEHTQVYCVFVHRDGDRRHGLLATLDLAWHGILTGIDVVAAARDIDRVPKDMTKDAHRNGGRFARIDPTVACDLLRAALDVLTDATLPPSATAPAPTESLYRGLPLAVRRVLVMPRGDLPPPPRRALAASWTPQRRRALVEEFFAARPDGWDDPAVARMVAGRIIDASADVLGWPPDRIGPASLTRLFGEVLPGTLVAPDAVLRQAEQVAEEWVEWLSDSRDLPKNAYRKLRRTALAVLGFFPQQCRDRRVNPGYPYVADLPADQAGGDELQKVLDRRAFAVPFPGRRGDGIVELPEPANGLPTGRTHVDDLDAADPTHRQLITAIGQTQYGVRQNLIPARADVVEQIWNDEPTSTWQAAQRLAATGVSRQRILERLGAVWEQHRPNTPGSISTGPDAGAADSYATALHSLGSSPGRRR